MTVTVGGGPGGGGGGNASRSNGIVSSGTLVIPWVDDAPGSVEQGHRPDTIGKRQFEIAYEDEQHWSIKLGEEITWIRTRSRPTRKQAADAIRKLRLRLPSKTIPNTLGYRCWSFIDGILYSPYQFTRWNGTELRVERWDEQAVVRGVAGIHAHCMPRDWKSLRPDGNSNVTGVVERFGKYVLGVEGWRAEWVVIKELKTCPEFVEALRAAFPEIPIHVADLGEWNIDFEQQHMLNLRHHVFGQTILHPRSMYVTMVGGGGSGGGGGGGGAPVFPTIAAAIANQTNQTKPVASKVFEDTIVKRSFLRDVIDFYKVCGWKERALFIVTAFAVVVNVVRVVALLLT